MPTNPSFPVDVLENNLAGRSNNRSGAVKRVNRSKKKKKGYSGLFMTREDE